MLSIKFCCSIFGWQVENWQLEANQSVLFKNAVTGNSKLMSESFSCLYTQLFPSSGLFWKFSVLCFVFFVFEAHASIHLYHKFTIDFQRNSRSRLFQILQNWVQNRFLTCWRLLIYWLKRAFKMKIYTTLYSLIEKEHLKWKCIQQYFSIYMYIFNTNGIWRKFRVLYIIDIFGIMAPIQWTVHPPKS